MQINLRKAAAAIQTLEAELKSMYIDSQAEVAIYSSLEEVTTKVRGEALKTLGKQEEYITAIYEMRDKVAKANIVARITDLLCEIAEADRFVQLYSALSTNPSNLSEVENQLNFLRKRAESSEREVKTSVYVNAFSESDVESFKTALAKWKRKRRELQDRLLEANISGKITVSDKVQEILKEVGVI